MNIVHAVERSRAIFLDTAPLIYYIEAHPLFGPLTKDLLGYAASRNIALFSSVITLTEVLAKPLRMKRTDLADRFAQFLTTAMVLTDVSAATARTAAELCAKFPSLKTVDAIQIATALELSADVFVTNDRKLTRVEDIHIVVLADCLP